MIIKEWFSDLLQQFFNADTSKRNESLINLLSEFLDILQQERFSDDLYSPLNLLRSLSDLINIDEVSNKDIKEHYKLFYPFGDFLNNRINEKTDWRDFVKLLPQIYANSGLAVNLDFFKFLTGEIEYEKMNKLNDEHVALLNRIGLSHLIDDRYFFNTALPMNKNNLINNIIPNLYNITNLDNLLINKQLFFEFLTTVKPAGVLFLLINFIVFDKQQIINKVNQNRFAIRDSFNQVYTTYKDIVFEEVDRCENLFDFEELRSMTFIESFGLVNWWDNRIFSHTIDFNFLSDKKGYGGYMMWLPDINNNFTLNNAGIRTIV